MDTLTAVAAVSGLLLSASLVLLLVRSLQPPRKAPAEAPAPVDERPVVRVCFGTQTGTAEKFSKQLAAALAEQYGEQAARVEVVDLERYDHATALGGELAVFFLVATYGDGEPTDNAAALLEWLGQAAEEVANGERPDVCKARRRSAAACPPRPPPRALALPACHSACCRALGDR